MNKNVKIVIFLFSICLYQQFQEAVHSRRNWRKMVLVLQLQLPLPVGENEKKKSKAEWETLVLESECQKCHLLFSKFAAFFSASLHLHSGGTFLLLLLLDNSDSQILVGLPADLRSVANEINNLHQIKVANFSFSLQYPSMLSTPNSPFSSSEMWKVFFRMELLK